MTYENKKRKDTQSLIGFIIAQGMELPEYHTISKNLQENYIIHKKGGGMELFTDELIDAIIDWEKGHQTSSLEELLYNNFLIYKRI